MENIIWLWDNVNAINLDIKKTNIQVRVFGSYKAGRKVEGKGRVTKTSYYMCVKRYSLKLMKK